MQLQVHQYVLSGRGSTSGNFPKDVLSTGESVNKMGEVEDEESLNEVTVSSHEELLEEILLGELEETPSDPRELEELNCDPLEVPPTISHHFYILHVLDLSYTEINSLPKSISRLVALQKLILRSCELLMELPPEIGELTNLEVLDLEGTEILCLPKEIAKLVNLTCLKVSFYGYANQTVIPRRVLSNLSSLIELIIDVTPFGEWWDVGQEAIVDDLCSLKELRTLQLYSPTAKPLEELTLIFPGLANFRFIVGRHEEHFISRLPHDVEEEFNNWEKLGRGLKYLNGNRIPNGVTEVLKHANAFFLQRHWTAKSLSEFGHKNISGMKFCLVMECNEFRTIIDSQQFNQRKDGRGESEDFEYFDKAIVLGSLERLIIRYMKNMESIWKGPVGKGSLSNLKSLALHTCPNLTTLFTIDMVGNLINLEELIVEDCPKIDSIMSLKRPGSKLGLFLPSLTKISLLELPELVSISSGLCIAPNLERMVIFYCPKLEKLSTMDVSSTNLKVIKGEREWWDALKWYESDLSTEHEDYLAGLFIPLMRDGDLMAQLKNECSPLKSGLNQDKIQARVRNIDEVGHDDHEYRLKNIDEIRHDYNESGVGGCGIKGDRPPLLAPLPGIAQHVIDNVSSTWDILKSFEPQDDEELCSTDGLAVTTSVMTKEEDRGIEKDDEGGDDEIVGKLDMGKALVRDDSDGSESCSDTSDSGMDGASLCSSFSAATGESWEKGEFFGSGSFGTVYEGIIDSKYSPLDMDDSFGMDEASFCSSFSAATGESLNCISPNGEFKSSIKSWEKGELLGSGSFGTVYEGITDSKFRLFSSGVELGNLLLSSDLLHHSWDAIDKLYRETPPNHDPTTSPLSIKYKVHQQSPIGTIISFISSPPCTPQYLQTEGRDLLASSDALATENFPLFQFVGTKVNPTFSLHRAAVTLFSSLQDQLSLLKTQYEKTRPLIVTGHSIGGSIASLFTLWLLEAIPLTDRERPLCITFGCPLIGDTGLQQAVSERLPWISCFLHVASYKDPIPKLFASSSQNERSIELGYKPFGTFLLCSESGFVCFEEPESALDLMVATSLDGVGNGCPHEGAQMFCYGEILEKYKHGVICRGVSQLKGKDFAPRQMGISIQIAPINVETTQRRLENGDINSLITKIERTKDLAARKRNVFNPDKKLSHMKINMTYVEWYKKVSVPLGGYYDVFRNERSTRTDEIVKRKTILTQFWVKIVKEAEKRPQGEGKFLLIRYLNGGNSYRRIVEPLDIAEFYKKGKQNYLAQRSDHYKLLEKWMEDEKSEGNQGNAEERNRACSLTEDSCFWAYVEEAMILCKSLKNGETSPELKESLRADLVKFEDYVMDLVRKYAVSTEIFLKQSSFMRWWEDYKEIKGALYRSSLADFMSNCKYKEYA